MTTHGERDGTVFAESRDSPALVAERLRGRLAPISLATTIDHVYERRFVGHVRGEDVFIWPVGPTTVRGRPVWHLWTPLFKGRLMNVAPGTTLVGRIRLNRFIPVFGFVFAVILADWLWVGIDATIGHVQQGKALDSGLIFAALLMPALFGLFLGLFYYVGYRLFVQDRIELTAFLAGALASPDEAGIAPESSG